MKTTRSIIQFGIALLALVLLLALLTVPVLANGLAAVKGDSMQPEKLDVRAIPVPTPPSSAANQPAISATPSLSRFTEAPAPQPIPVPTPPVLATPGRDSLTERQMPESSAAITVQIINRQEMIAMVLMFVALLFSLRLHQTSSFHSSHRGCA